MSVTTEKMLAAAKSASAGEFQLVMAQSKIGFLDAFRGFVNPGDLIELDAAFSLALKAKLGHLMAQTDNEAEDFADEYEASMNTIETIGDRYEIGLKARAGKFVRSFAHNVISAAAAVTGAVLQAGLGVVLGPLGTLIGAGGNVGLQHVVSYFLD